MEIDYEKEYTEALERAKRLRDSKYQTMNAKRVAEEIFPQLAESEDERMRKAALEGIEYLERDFGWDFIGDIDILDVKEYLEKQKDQKVDIDKLRKDIYQSGYNDGYRHGKEDAQKEQKPSEWDDYTKTNLDRAIQIIKKAKGKLQSYQTDDGIYECDKAIECLEHFLYRGLEIEKTAGWSEEDEKKRNGLIKGLQNRMGFGWASDPFSREDYIVWLKSLRPQPKAELTLLDKNIIEAAVAFIEQNDHFNCWRGVDKHTVIKALRSLKPRWKPSKEQMGFLLAVINDPNNAGSESCHLVLKELYEQLKTL